MRSIKWCYFQWPLTIQTTPLTYFISPFIIFVVDRDFHLIFVMFVKDKAKISSKVEGVKWRVVYFGKLVFEFDKQEYGLGGVKSKKNVLMVRNAWVKVEWVE